MNAKVQNAVQNTIDQTHTADGKTLAEVVSNLSKGDLAKSYKFMDAAYDIQFGADGIEDTQNKLQGLQGKVGEQVFAIAKLAMDHCGKDRLVIALSYFKTLCSKAEEYKEHWYTAKYKEEKPIGQLIPLWSQYKSRIAKGMEKGLNPYALIENTDAPLYATAAQYSTAVQKIEKEERATGSQAGEERNTEGQASTQLQLVVRGWSPTLSAAMDVMVKALNALNHEEQDKFANQILDIAAAAATFKNANKSHGAPVTGEVVTGENGEVTGTTRSDEPVSAEAVAALQDAVDSGKPKAEETPKATGRKTRAA